MESAGSAGSNMLPAASKGWLNKTRETIDIGFFMD